MSKNMHITNQLSDAQRHRAAHWFASDGSIVGQHIKKRSMEITAFLMVLWDTSPLWSYTWQAWLRTWVCWWNKLEWYRVSWKAVIRSLHMHLNWRGSFCENNSVIYCAPRSREASASKTRRGQHFLTKAFHIFLSIAVVFKTRRNALFNALKRTL